MITSIIEKESTKAGSLVGSDVWIGGGVSIMPGITIRDNVVIGSGNVVTKDVPSGVIGVGNLCKVIRGITEEKINIHMLDMEYH